VPYVLRAASRGVIYAGLWLLLYEEIGATRQYIDRPGRLKRGDHLTTSIR